MTNEQSIVPASREEIEAAASVIRYRSEFSKALNDLPEDVPGLKLEGWSLQRVRLAVAAFNNRRTDNRKFHVVPGKTGEIYVARN